MKKFMKHIVITMKVMMVVLTLNLLPSYAHAQTEGEFTIPLTDPGKRGQLIAQLNTGSITVKGTQRKDVLIKYMVVDGNEHKDKGEESKNGLKRISGGTMDLDASENSNVVKVGSDSWSNKMNLFIEVPSGIDVKVKAYNDGDILITDIQGEVEITNYNGEITANNISGSAVASTYNGNIKITFDKLTEGTPMSYSTYNGDIDLTFPSTFKGSLKMKTERGEIFTGFDVNLVKTGPVQKKETKSGTYRVTIDDWVKGDVNGGGPEFTMKNYNGDILIRKKQ